MKPEMKFCPTCGRGREAAETRRLWYQRPEVVGVAVFLLVGAVYWTVSGDKKQNTTGVESARAANVESYSDSRVLQIASKFYCPCGECKDDLASTCDCGMAGGATDVRKFIDAELRKGLSPDTVTAMVKTRFGHAVAASTALTL
jgi:hypothetical protein